MILQALYYSMVDMMYRNYSFAPTFLLKYKLDIASFIPRRKAPVTIFYGNNDSIIYYGSSFKLKQHFKSTDQLFTLKGGRHNGIHNNPNYLVLLDAILIGE